MIRAIVMTLVLATLAACVDNSAERYRQTAFALQIDGKLRNERAPQDAPFSNADLARNFERIALAREYRREDDRLIEEATPAPIARWSRPVEYRIEGATRDDLDAYEALIDRLADLTNLTFTEVSSDPNLTIVFLDAENRELFVEDLKASGDDQRMPLLIDWAENLRYPCVGQVGFQDVSSGEITGALIVIKDELEGVLRESCIHEELVQTLGLMNDDGDVRPSIFNDDQEFALMTEHDEYLLRILYDRRLRPGMKAEEARPIVREIIEDIRPKAAGDKQPGA